MEQYKKYINSFVLEKKKADRDLIVDIYLKDDVVMAKIHRDNFYNRPKGIQRSEFVEIPFKDLIIFKSKDPETKPLILIE